MKLQPGTVVERYTVKSLLGAGGTAMVYLVVHNQLKTHHALKVLTITSEAIRVRMLREGQVQAALKHLNVVAVTDVLDVEGNPGLVMEYIEGPSLETALQRYKLSMRDAEILYKGILAGVRHAHESGLVHRDLKPANVLLFQAENGYVPKVTDFGLAKVIEGEELSTGHTRSGIAMGTPSFMAPEQIRDARSVDQRADVFSLGCILYELLLRRRAFPGEEALEIYNKVCEGTYVAPSVYAPDIPERLDMAIRGCLITERRDRIPDCATLLQVMQGEMTWELPEATAEVPLRAPSVLDSQIPNMPVAARSPGGEAPRAAAEGRMGGLVALAEGEVTVPSPPPMETLKESPVDGTLDATDSIVPWATEEEERGLAHYLGIALMGALGTLVAIGFLVGGVGFLGSVLLNRELPPDLVEPTVVPATPHEGPEAPVANEEEAPAPAEVLASGPDVPAETEPTLGDEAERAVAQTPQVEPDPAPAPVVRTPRPAPRPKPPPPTPVTVKVLSQPPTAVLLVDGTPVGRTPAKLELLPGSHKVSVQSGEQTGEFDIRVTEGGDNKWCYAFVGQSAHPGSCPR